MPRQCRVARKGYVTELSAESSRSLNPEMTASSAHPQQTTFSAIVAELRFWPAVAAIGLEVIGLGLWGLMALESRGGTCVVRTCDEAHIPSPAFLAAMIATSTAMLLTPRRWM